jgi:hypothetical protein
VLPGFLSHYSLSFLFLTACVGRFSFVLIGQHSLPALFVIGERWKIQPSSQSFVTSESSFNSIVDFLVTSHVCHAFQDRANAYVTPE